MTISAVPLMACGELPAPVDGPLYCDVARDVPPIEDQTAEALKADRPFGEWVIYNARTYDDECKS
ncbi:MAG: hypothetical protein AAGK79_13340 [Pseudomonadota bacterium]